MNKALQRGLYMTTAYTVGDRKLFDESLKSDDPRKSTLVGKTDLYEGGVIWKTLNEAQQEVSACAGIKDFGEGPIKIAIYEIELPHGWAGDTYIPEGTTQSHLLHDAKIVKRKDYVSLSEHLAAQIPTKYEAKPFPLPESYTSEVTTIPRIFGQPGHDINPVTLRPYPPHPSDTGLASPPKSKAEMRDMVDQTLKNADRARKELLTKQAQPDPDSKMRALLDLRNQALKKLEETKKAWLIEQQAEARRAQQKILCEAADAAKPKTTKQGRLIQAMEQCRDIAARTTAGVGSPTRGDMEDLGRILDAALRKDG